MNNLRIITLNLANADYQRFERGHLVVEELARRQPHLVALQELCVINDMSNWLVNRLNEWTFGDKYTAYFWNKIGPQGAFEGLSILSRLPIEGPSEAIDLQGGGRIAHRVSVNFIGTKITFCNLHLHHTKGLDDLRESQGILIAEWMMREGGTVPIIAGDFNSTPTSKVMTSLFRMNWRSAYREHHGEEPPKTFPTPIIKNLNNGNLTISLNDWFEPRVIDYVLLPPSQVIVNNAELCFCGRGETNNELHPSDHYGIMVDLGIE